MLFRSSYTIHVTALSPVDGTVLAEADLASKITDGPESILSLTRDGKEGPVVRLAWLEDGQIRSVALTPTLKDKPTAVKGALYQKIHDIKLSDNGIFVALKEDGAGRVIKLNEDGTGLKVIWEFADSVSILTAHLTSTHTVHAR